jgi:hypothetical protein
MSTRHPKSWAKSLFYLLQAGCAEVFQSVDRSTALVQSLRRQRIARVGARDPQCAMRIGALDDTRQLWQPCLAPDAYGVGREEIDLAMRIGGKTEQEIVLLRRKFSL